MKNHYIQAVLELIEQNVASEKILSGLSRALENKGHQRLHVAILRGVVRQLQKQMISSVPRVVTAYEADTQKYEQAITEALQMLSVEAQYVTHIDDTIVGGFIVEYNNKMIDNSYKTRLISLYRTLTK